MIDLFLWALTGSFIFGFLFSIIFAYRGQEVAALICLAIMGFAMTVMGSMAVSAVAYDLWVELPCSGTWFQTAVLWFNGIGAMLIGAIIALIGGRTLWDVSKDLGFIAD